MAKERALTLEALRVMDAIDRRGSFAAAADELGRVPSALSYTMQKLEEELDVVLFDRSGHRTKFTNVGRMLLERGRVLLEAADKLTTDAEALARGWETHLTLVTEALVPTEALFPLVNRLADKANTQLSIITEVLAGARREHQHRVLHGCQTLNQGLRRHVVTIDNDVVTIRTQLICQVIGKGVDVIEQQNVSHQKISCAWCAVAMARNTARALLRVSSASDCGTESRTTPAPAWTVAIPSST